MQNSTQGPLFWGESLRCIARSRGITVGLLGGLELLLFKLLRLSRLGEACTVILCWKSVGCGGKKKKRERENWDSMILGSFCSPSFAKGNKYRNCQTGRVWSILGILSPFLLIFHPGSSPWVMTQTHGTLGTVRPHTRSPGKEILLSSCRARLFWEES